VDGEGAERRRAARGLVRHHLWICRRTFGGALLGAALYSAFVLTIPLVAAHSLDHTDSTHVRQTIIVIVALGVGRALSGALRKYQATKNPALVTNGIRVRLYDHVQRLSFSFHDRIGAGQLMARASTDVSMLEQSMSPLPWFCQSIFMFVAGVVLLFLKQPVLAGAVATVVALAMWFALSKARALYPTGAAVQEKLGHYSQFAEQQVQGIRVVKGHGFEQQFGAVGGRFADEVRAAGLDRARARARFQASMLATPGLALLVVISLGGWLGAQGRLTEGDMLVFVLYLSLLVSPVAAGAELLTQWPQGMAAAARIAEVLAAEPDVAEPPHARHLPAGPGRIEFDHVSFGYVPRAGSPSGREAQPSVGSGAPRSTDEVATKRRGAGAIVDELSLTIAGGESVALVGASGSGKSTLAYLLCRFYDVWGGQIRLDGARVDELSLTELRHAVSVVFEDTVVFTASIRANLAIGRPEATDAELQRAAELAEAHRFIVELPDGYDTVVGPQGYSLSGGQRQRLAIARAILRDSRVLVLDDAMSAVDPPTEAAIRAGLVHAMEGRTTLIIAHRVETISLADRVVLLERGHVVADGTHDELLGLPAYRRALALDDFDATSTSAPARRIATAGD
jgi:ATP-binding cassette subfamily B protein